MAHFHGTIEGQGDPVSRLGSPASGLIVRAEGSKAGVAVQARVTEKGDVFFIHATAGTHGGQVSRLVAIVRETRDGFKIDKA